MSLTKHEKLAPNSGIFGLICLVQEILFVKGGSSRPSPRNDACEGEKLNKRTKF